MAAMKVQGGRMVPMDKNMFSEVNYVNNQLLQAFTRVREAEVLMRKNGDAATAAKLKRTMQMLQEITDYLSERLMNN